MKLQTNEAEHTPDAGELVSSLGELARRGLHGKKPFR
jgi:hypothetical protein